MLSEELKKCWSKPIKEVFKDFKTSSSGLSPNEAQERSRIFGSNIIAMNGHRSAAAIFLSQFTSPLVLILIGASLISGYLGDHASTAIILLIISSSACLAFYQEYKSEKAVAQLRSQVSLKATVLRSGQALQIAARDLVPGDIVLLEIGNVVPADLRLLEADNLLADESLLTGESFPVEKGVEPIKIKEFMTQAASNMLFMGTHIAQGLGKGIVVATGSKTAISQTAHLLEIKPQETEFQKGVRNFGGLLLKVILLFTLAVFLILIFYKNDPIADSLLFALAIAVGISPELLPIIITINLSQGAKRMAKEGVIVKKLMSIEDLGNAEILCTDKTGTLTEGKIKVNNCLDLNGQYSQEVLAYGWWCNSLTIIKSIIGSPLDEAIVDFAKNKKCESIFNHAVIVKAFPFDFKRRRMSVIVKKQEEYLLVCKGATEEVLAVCQDVKIDGQIVPLKSKLDFLTERFAEFSAKGLRLLLVATKNLKSPVDPNWSVTEENKLTLVGFITFEDRPKDSAKESLQALSKLGVEIKVLSGDNELACSYLCQQVGCEVAGVLRGEEIEELTETDLQRIVTEVNLFVKITPEHKLRIIQALKTRGKTVAFLGDGVNDAPALRAADVGISVDSAVDVAKEAADIILLRKSLKVLAEGITAGRKTFGNTLKYIFCTISSNFGNMFSVVGAAFFLPYIPMLPTQILLLNFLSDFPMLAVSADRVDEEYLRRPKHWDVKIINRFMIYFGSLSSIFDFLTFIFLWFVAKANSASSQHLFQTGWFWESYLTEVIMIFIVRTRKLFWRSRPSLVLIVASLITTVLVLGVIYSGINAYFNFDPLPLWVLLAITLITLAYFFLIEIAKNIFYKKFDI